jgi:hypothetical protein
MDQDAPVIVTVEGPSAAGKTTWCRQHASETVVEEYEPTGSEPDGSDLRAQAAYYVGVSTSRWRAAQELEARSRTAVCDGDPLKLHYSWCLAQIGAAPWSRFEQELALTRRAILSGGLGFADFVLISIPSAATLHAHYQADTSRRRHSFALHSRLGPPLRSWYQAVEALDPGRVLWELPTNGLPSPAPEPRPRRCDPGLLDQLVGLLPSQ